MSGRTGRIEPSRRLHNPVRLATCRGGVQTDTVNNPDGASRGSDGLQTNPLFAGLSCLASVADSPLHTTGPFAIMTPVEGLIVPNTGLTKKIMLVSSDRREWFETVSDEEHFRKAPYSVGAILYHLSKLGWTTSRAGWKTSSHPKVLAKKIDEFRPDIIYTYGSTVALNPLFCRKRLCNWKHFKVIHGWDDLYGDIWGALFGWAGRIFMNCVEKRIVTRSDGVVTLSYFLQNRGKTWGVDCKYIPNGADPVDRSAIQGNIKLDGKMNLVYTGDQARWKRTAEICEAMRHVPREIKLYLTGQHYPYLDKYASDNCIFLGYISKEEQFNVMSQADVFVCTSDQDCNAKIQEYLRWERPYLGYDGRANLFFKNGRNALLTQNYSEAIMRLYECPGLRIELATNAKRDIPLHSWAEIAGQFEAFFLSMTARGGSK